MTLTELPNNIDALKQLVLDTHRQVVARDEQIAERDERLTEHEATIKELQSQLACLKHKLFGQRSEKIDSQQLLLFNELQSKLDALEEKSEQEKVEREEIAYTRRKSHGRKPLPDDLPVEEVEYHPDETDCPCCGEQMKTIGQEVTDEVDYNPGSLFIRRHIRPKYACRACEEGVHIASMPPRPIDKGIAGPGLLAYVLTSKYADHLPLNRLSGMLRRHRLDVSVTTMCDWVARMADLLTPIYEQMQAELISGDLIQSDDTEAPYQLKGQEKKMATGYLWTYLNESKRLVLYDFTESRRRDGPTAFLSGFKGTLLTDGYAGYNEAVERYGLIRAGCWSHARRKFYDVRKDDPRRCGPMLKLIQCLFAVEQKAKELREKAAKTAAQSDDACEQTPSLLFGDAEHLAMRQAESAPLIEEIKRFAEAWSIEVLPRSGVGRAVGYVRNQWEPLTRFLEDPTVPLHNNASERAMRHVVIGRKNWIFAGSAAGGHRAAKIYSVVVTCRENGVDPFVYLRDVIDRLPRGEDPAKLLPANWKAEQLKRADPDS